MQRYALLRRAGTQAASMGPGSAAHHAAKGSVLRSIRGTRLKKKRAAVLAALQVNS